jgi:hypothetical protein
MELEPLRLIHQAVSTRLTECVKGLPRRRKAVPRTACLAVAVVAFWRADLKVRLYIES